MPDTLPKWLCQFIRPRQARAAQEVVRSVVRATWGLPSLLMNMPGGGGSSLQTPDTPGGLGLSYRHSPGLCFLTRENSTCRSDTQTAKDARRFELGVSSQGHKTPERCPALTLGSINHNRDDHSSSASLQVSRGAISRLTCILAPVAFFGLTRICKKQVG